MEYKAQGLFPFGRPLEPTRPSADGPRSLFLLGAYPSALHIQWTPPAGQGRGIKALAVDNEPEPFWTGQEEVERIASWRDLVRWTSEMGQADLVGVLNGSTGRTIDSEVLGPLGVTREQTWLTDCLDTYHLSKGMSSAIQERYAPIAEKEGWTQVKLPKHPSERAIVDQAQMGRLQEELATARPEIIVTLGEAALEAMGRLLQRREQSRLKATDQYGSRVEVKVNGESAIWYPLVHRGQRRPEWRQVHEAWIARMGNRG